MRDWSTHDLPREKLLQNGKSTLSDVELLAILIGSGSRNESAVDLSRRILASVNNELHRLSRLDIAELMNFNGIGEAKAICISAALELAHRKRASAISERKTVSSSRDAFNLIAGSLLELDHEEFWVLLLNRANRLIEMKNISKGGVSGTVADAKLIFKSALSKLSSSIIICHNHPSGNLKPSKADIQLTKKIVEGGKNLDIAVLDHLILGNNSYFSFADEGMI